LAELLSEEEDTGGAEGAEAVEAKTEVGTEEVTATEDVNSILVV